MAIETDQDYSRELVCNYRGEYYSVRDNGALMRHPNGHDRPLDNVWTFGRLSPDGYLYFRENPVHRIVATAFLGEPPSMDYVVDHIDTNRQNNRPENLRWLTRLENILNNPITVSRIIRICGSIEAFLEDPSVLRDIEGGHSWMRRVTKEEAKNALDNLLRLSRVPPGEYHEWVRRKDASSPRILTLEQSNTFSALSIGSYDLEHGIGASFCYDILELGNYTVTPARNECALQYGWQPAILFENCPASAGIRPLEEYHSRLAIGDLFIIRPYADYVITETLLTERHILFVCSKILFHPNRDIEVWNMTAIGMREGKFMHQNLSFFFNSAAVIEAMNFARTIQPESWIYKPLIPGTSSIHMAPEAVVSTWKDILVKYRNKPRLYNILNKAEYIKDEYQEQIIIRTQNDSQRIWIQTHIISDIEDSMSATSASLQIVVK